MELFNIDGTIKTSFAIGTGTNQIEFRSFNGKFFYRNYGEPWKEVAGAGGKVRPWQSGARFEQGELVSNNGILYVVLEDHDSGLLFDTDGNKMGRVSVFDELTIFNVSTDSELRLSPSTSNKVFITNTTATEKNIYLPDAQKIQVGTHFEIQNDSNITVPIYYNDNTTQFQEVRNGSILFVTCLSNTTTNGTWAFYDFTVETGLVVTPVKFSTYNASANQLVPCNTTSGSFEINLPIAPANGDTVGILDVAGTFQMQPLTINRNGKKIQDFAENWEIDISGTFIELIYVQPKNSWFFKEVPAGSGGSNPYDIYNVVVPKEPPTISSFTISGGPLREFGDAITSVNTVDFTVICSPGTEDITTISFVDVDDELVLGEITSDVSEGGEFTFTYAPSAAINVDNVYRVSVTDNNLAAISTINVRFISRVYWGFSDNASLTTAEILALPNSTLTTSLDIGEYSFGSNSTLVGAYIYFVYPSSFGPLIEVEDTSNGIVYSPANFTTTLQNVINPFGVEKEFRVYRTNIKTFGGSFNWKVYLS